MRVIHSASPNQALMEGLYHLHYNGLTQGSRVGDVVVSNGPVLTVHKNPKHHVLVNELRDANPFFHLFEAMWMLAGRNDLLVPKTFVSTFGQFSDDGVTLNGAYGHRWRTYFGFDQLEVLIGELKANPTTRRAVLQMWDAGAHDDSIGQFGTVGPSREGDLMKAISGSADVPCNTAAYFDTVDGKLNMTVTCRSNDVILGAYGANIVHMSLLLEYVALRAGLSMGVYRQFSNNYHVYTSRLPRDQFTSYAEQVVHSDIYQRQSGVGIRGALVPRDPMPRTVPLLDVQENWDDWEKDLHGFMREIEAFNVTPGQSTVWDAKVFPLTVFFRDVVRPMFYAWKAWKAKDYDTAFNHARHIIADDWRAAAQSWLIKRHSKVTDNG